MLPMNKTTQTAGKKSKVSPQTLAQLKKLDAKLDVKLGEKA